MPGVNQEEWNMNRAKTAVFLILGVSHCHTALCTTCNFFGAVYLLVNMFNLFRYWTWNFVDLKWPPILLPLARWQWLVVPGESPSWRNCCSCLYCFMYCMISVQIRMSLRTQESPHVCAPPGVSVSPVLPDWNSSSWMLVWLTMAWSHPFSSGKAMNHWLPMSLSLSPPPSLKPGIAYVFSFCLLFIGQSFPVCVYVCVRLLGVGWGWIY